MSDERYHTLMIGLWARTLKHELITEEAKVRNEAHIAELNRA